MAHDYLTDLNQEQRRAVKHGVKDGSALNSRPLLVIAGAGSGKTKTLAHRVAHLVVNGIDPQRILLLTFSRRAALDMTGRVKRITGAAIGIAEIDLPWAGTFHAVGARILREFADRIGLKPSFTILDRSDAADLMDVVRHDLGMSKKESRFPRKDTCLAIYSYAINKVRTGGIFFTPVTGMMALLTLSLALFAKGARPRGWMILLTCLFLVHQLISFARGYWFGLLAALPYLFVVYIRRGEGMRTRIKKVGFALAWVALLVGVGVVVLSVWFGWTDIASLLLTRVASSVGTEASSQTASNIERLVEYRASLRSIASSPLVGHGLGYTLQIHQPIFNVITTQWFVHQTYLWLLLKEGVLGLTAYLLVLVAAVRAGTIGALRSEGAVAGWCAASAACTIYLAGIGLTNFSLVQVNSTFLLGLLWGLSLSLTHVPGYLIRWRIVPGPAVA